MDILPGYILKLVRATVLYNLIYAQSATYVQDELKYNASPQFIAGHEWDILTWADGLVDPDPMLGVLAGELVHDVRSALDHLVYRLIRDNNRDPGKHSQFPIYDNREEWVRDIEERDPCRSIPSPIEGVTDEEFAMIEGAQPYHLLGKKRSGHPLMKLLRMSNVDKHQTLHVTALSAHTPIHTFYHPRGYMRIVRKRFVQPQTLVKPGTEIGRVEREIIREISPDTQVQVRLQGVAQLVFGEPDKVPFVSVTDLGEMIRAARHVVNDLRPWTSVPLPEGW